MNETNKPTCRIPVEAVMSIQPDGSVKMTSATYADIGADDIARLLMGAFGVPMPLERVK